ncbi:DUF6270 domain-containing protein [Lactococcus cremoris]|uniref:Major teichoic acid biosynthesis protein C n=1 Tax=Lactococcus lactis subsp. cremoris (strain MG1363) TaxID=416870 RepID=A2RLL3_LACLM|nr:DUF6270 domain-containing protein [Lactococcus cremoris]ADJ60595.1 hypothetical protein LLNZ_08265 [Lactococcus cremoris subsp. cremoris NZ9000]MCT4435831.1 hypothetical protein [Lactococcus cremoris]MCZ7689899.1 DUF6270 domain-containing protein [Lactococcus cremoris]MCZ7691608.1 DUF6270 domain-containing protein [Lactococcus cremoris]MRM08862.1 hypothetical protein [Lactococcus cremoris subsp. cremoris MG1363]
MMKNRVAIIGSYLSRELFDKNKQKSEEEFEIVLYRKNLSFISLMSKAIEYDYKKLDTKLKVDNVQQMLDELDKDTLSALIAVQPDILILDFYGDVFNGVIETQEGSFLTNSFKDVTGAYLLSDVKIKRQMSSNRSVQEFLDYSSIWCQTFDSFVEFIQRFLPETLVLVNTINFIEETKRKNNVSQVWLRFNEYAQKKGIPVINDSLLELYQHIFGNFKINQLELFSQAKNKIEKTKKISETSLTYNLINNADFSEGKKYWQDDSGEYFVKNGILEINRQTMEGFTILHSAPIQISNDGNSVHKFELSMEVWVENLFALHLNDAFFYIWTYDDKVTREIKETKIYSSKLENLSSGKWKHINIELKCKGKYLELGPHMVGAGHFRYRNLSLSLKD